MKTMKTSSATTLILVIHVAFLLTACVDSRAPDDANRSYDLDSNLGDSRMPTDADAIDDLSADIDGTDPLAPDGGLLFDVEDADDGSEAQDCEASSEVHVLPPDGYVLILAGEFTMGSPETEAGRAPDEFQHQVTITQSFYLKATEVTQAEWLSVMSFETCYAGACGAELPVSNVNWYEALAFCNALSRREGLEQCYDLGSCVGLPGDEGFTCPGGLTFSMQCSGYRLPTDAEWEYAYRSGTSTAFYNGDISDIDCADPKLDEIARYCGNSSGLGPVGQRAPSPWGHFDMSGGVWEWTWDWFSILESDATDPTGPTTGQHRIYRGGAYGTAARYCRASYRYGDHPGARYIDLGFRPVRTLSF